MTYRVNAACSIALAYPTLSISPANPGDVVTWMLPRNLPHIGIVTGKLSAAGTPFVVHDIGRSPEIEDMLFSYPITGHYRYGLR